MRTRIDLDSCKTYLYRLAMLVADILVLDHDCILGSNIVAMRAKAEYILAMHLCSQSWSIQAKR